MSSSIELYTQGSHQNTLDVLLKDSSPLQNVTSTYGPKDCKFFKPKDEQYAGISVMYTEPDPRLLKISIRLIPSFEALTDVMDVNDIHGELSTTIERQNPAYLELYMRIGKYLNDNNVPYFIIVQKDGKTEVLGGQNPLIGSTFKNPRLRHDKPLIE